MRMRNPQKNWKDSQQGSEASTEKTYEVNMGVFLVKLVIVILFLLLLISSISILIEERKSEMEFHNDFEYISWCDRLYYNRDFSGLLGELRLYELQGETYDIYWEAVNAYQDYLKWHSWHQSLSSKSLKNAVSMEKEYRGRVIENAKSCRNEQNQKLLNSYVEQLESSF